MRRQHTNPNSNPISLLLLLLSSLPLATSSRPNNAILLSQVRTLTLRGSNAQTAHRRVPSVPQLKCVSAPSICRLHAIDVMRCTNQGAGYDSEDIQWSCTAPLPPELKLGSTDVACEGYSGPDDPYVLKGSCGVEYRLALTEVGEQRYPDIAKGSGGWGWGGGGGGDKDRGSGSSDPSAVAFAVIFALVCLWIIYSACVAGNQDPTRPGAQRRRNNWGGFGGGFDPGFGPGGGGGGDGWDDPPPPYSGGPKFSSSQSQGWRPGFWTGLAGGAAAGYAAAGRRNNQQERNSGYGWGAGPSSSAGGSGSRSTSSARYESTGFGSTSRR